jgi:hypothetical protein
MAPNNIGKIAEALGRSLEERAAELVAMLEVENITHGPTIGNAFENLLQDQLGQFLPSGRQIKVVTRSFARGWSQSGPPQNSGELDCMVVLGEGRRPTPYLRDEAVYSVDDVVAVVSVKKVLRPKDFLKLHDNLRSVVTLVPEKMRFGTPLMDQVFEKLTGHPAPKHFEELPPDLLRIYGHLMIEMNQPLRAVFGYSGYKTEKGLRSATETYVGALLGVKGNSPATLPNLILSPRAAVIKADGLPWISPLRPDGCWPLLVSNGELHPIRVLVTMLWTRLRSRGLVDAEPFAGETDSDSLSPLLGFRWQEGLGGWELC